MRPKYFNEGSYISGVQYSDETPPNRSSVSATTNLRCFLSDPLQHIAEVGCSQLSAYCGTNISHWGTGGGVDSLPLVLLCCPWSVGGKKCTQRFVCEDSDPRHPSTGHLGISRMVVNDTLYCTVVPYLTIPSLFPPSPLPPLGRAVG